MLSLTVSAADSFDCQNRPLTFRWALLQGDPARVKIEPAADGRQARLTLAWHDRFPVQPGSDIDSNRVDIGVFATNGLTWSAPAFVCVFYPDNELRTYDPQGRLVDLHSAAGDTTIGYGTTNLLPAEGVPAYDVRDWLALLDRACTPGDGLVRSLFQAAFSDGQRTALLAVRADVRARLAQGAAARKTEPVQPPASPAGSANPQLSRREGEWCGAPLVAASAELGGTSAKALLEGVLNTWKDDAEFYLRQRVVLDAAIASREPDVRRRLASGRQRLIDFGILSPVDGGDGWQLQSVCTGDAPVTRRLTQYERLELKRFHLLLLTHVLLPGIVQRDYLLNYVDHRLARREPYWDVFQYGDDAQKPPVVRRRQTDAPPPPPAPLEDP
jgi:hypothetical protein